MDYIRVFEVELDKVIYHAGETLSGHVYLEVEENMRLQNIKILLRGKAHTEWKITRAGERRTMKQDETYMEEKMLLWGKEDNDANHGVPILTRGRHHYPFNFLLPESALPCSFESKIGTIRYYVRVNIHIPYASCPQSVKYFTIIGPRLDCMDERFLVPVQALAKRNSCSLCCGKGPLVLRAAMDRTSYMCGEQIKLKADIQNGSDTEVWVVCKLVQYVEFFINKGVLGLTKEVRHTVLEAKSDKVSAHDASNLDELVDRLTVPVMPPTLEETCGLIQIYYTLKLYLDTPKGKGDTAEISFPVTICTMPYRNPNASPPEVYFDNAASNVEGGMYMSTEFQLGQVYMGDETDTETDQTILYRPVYMCTKSDIPDLGSDSHHLQVPSRQGGRSPENIRSSREEFPQQENMSATNTAPLSSAKENVDGAKGGKAKPEDKFLQEITARIANRQLSEDGEAIEGMGKKNLQPHEIESQVDMMRKQKQSNDFVHKALVNELRRHLSDADESAPAAKGPPLKKAPGVKKQTSESSVTSHTESEKRLKTEIKSEAEMVTTTTQETVTVSSRPVSENPESHIQDVELEVETNETTALIQDPDKDEGEHTPMDTTNANTETSPLLAQDDSLPPPPPSPPMQQQIHDHSSFSTTTTSTTRTQETTSFTTYEMTESSHSQEKCENTEVDMSVDVTEQKNELSSVIQEGTSVDGVHDRVLSAVAPEPKPRSPKVAPKPRHKDRYSFPVGQLSSEGNDDLCVETKRPKSEFVGHMNTHSSHTDSTV